MKPKHLNRLYHLERQKKKKQYLFKERNLGSVLLSYGLDFCFFPHSKLTHEATTIFNILSCREHRYIAQRKRQHGKNATHKPTFMAIFATEGKSQKQPQAKRLQSLVTIQKYSLPLKNDSAKCMYIQIRLIQYKVQEYNINYNTITCAFSTQTLLYIQIQHIHTMQIHHIFAHTST